MSSIKNKRKFILEQIINVCDWVRDFDPSNVNFVDMKLPQKLKGLDKYSNEVTKEYTRQNRLVEYKKNLETGVYSQ